MWLLPLRIGKEHIKKEITDGGAMHGKDVRFATTLACLSIASMLGVLTRVAINELFGNNGLQITAIETVLLPDLLSNMFGCFLIGIINSLRKASTLPLLLGLTLSTGYAGSVTSM